MNKETLSRSVDAPTSFVTERLKPNWVDAALTGLSPMLIVGMICCLVFFLVTVVYSGNFTIRLMYIFGLYTFASVFTARIAIEQSRALATTYASILGVATLAVTMRFVEFSGSFAPFSIPATIGFLVLIAFLADRITYDCTLIDDASDGSSEGLLQSLGLVKSAVRSSVPPYETSSDADSRIELANAPKTTKKSRALKKKRHNPGIWVLYFAFLAIPLFGLGQMTIPSWDRIRNQLAFVFLIGYLYCTLSLLVVTSLLGLRRYLRRRKVDMPNTITAVWFFSGIIGIIAMLGLLSLISLPAGSTGLFSLPFTITSSTGLKPSTNGWGPEGIPAEKPGTKKSKDNQVNSEQKHIDAPEQNNEGNPPSDKGSNGGKGNEKNGSGKDNQKTKSDSQAEKQSKADSEIKTNSASNPSKPNSPNQDKRDQVNQPKQESKTDTNKPTDENRQAGSSQPEQKSEKPKNRANDSPSNTPTSEAKAKQPIPPNEKPPAAPDSATKPSWSVALTGGLANLFRWLFMLGLLIFVGYCIIRYRSDLIKAWKTLTQWLRSLFQMATATVHDSSGENTSARIHSSIQIKSFADYSDPFQQNPSQWTPPKIVAHTFEATEAWASERSFPRKSNETAEEYLTRLATRYPSQIDSFQRLTGLYNRLAYAAQSVDASESNRLASYWNWLKKTTVS